MEPNIHSGVLSKVLCRAQTGKNSSFSVLFSALSYPTLDFTRRVEWNGGSVQNVLWDADTWLLLKVPKQHNYVSALLFVPCFLGQIKPLQFLRILSSLDVSLCFLPVHREKADQKTPKSYVKVPCSLWRMLQQSYFKLISWAIYFRPLWGKRKFSL